ncbi:MAG: response regulator [Gammaproteobacteria bacterium]|uniref:Response regulator n=1 Tax=Candidatus Kutchimonas denitrificans TaxID=3056748 RepID=A0AAE5CD59_9BACT|nr:response regulator [Gemmatimonadota bacterium]NIR75149.1 response regulator [Candidatus Kutchimonas denitrificans]NIU52959.1 response regulator [Gemmatimonadota bacterium]NIV52428.1 response regulator [Gammaproteobacteria bacterium]NIY44848.1 response regulator [Gemmatimonadota bacterium]
MTQHTVTGNRDEQDEQMNESASRPPVAIIANDHEWSSRSIKSILTASGYAVLITYTGRKTLEQALSTGADLVLVDRDLPDMTGTEVCQALRGDPCFSASTPILMTSSGNGSRSERLKALAAGAWDYLPLPFDSEELLLRLDSYVRAKLNFDRVAEEGMIDPISGLYNLRGLMRRARELGSDAYRHGRALACIALAPNFDPRGDSTLSKDNAPLWDAVKHLAEILRKSGRVSDAIGRMRLGDFVVLAASTDSARALMVAERLKEAAEAGPGAVEELTLAVGYDAVSDFRVAGIQPAALLAGATAALRQSQQAGNGIAIRRFSGDRDTARALQPKD